MGDLHLFPKLAERGREAARKAWEAHGERLEDVPMAVVFDRDMSWTENGQRLSDAEARRFFMHAYRNELHNLNAAAEAMQVKGSHRG